MKLFTLYKNYKNKSNKYYEDIILFCGKNFAKDDEKAIIETIISLCN